MRKLIVTALNLITIVLSYYPILGQNLIDPYILYYNQSAVLPFIQTI
jgi:hypothetical protein